MSPSPVPRPVGRTTPAHGEQTKARLVAVAREMFAASGHAGVAMQNVCARAAVTRGALYHHFPGKDGLFRAVCEQVATDVTARVAADAQEKPDAAPTCRCAPRTTCARSCSSMPRRCWVGLGCANSMPVTDLDW